MYVRIVGQQPLSVRVIEVRAVIYGCLLCGCSAEDFGLPGVEMRVEVDYGYGTVGFVDGAQKGKRYSMIAAQGYDAREGLFVLGGADLFCVGSGCAREEAVVAFFDLLDCMGVVVAGAVSGFCSSSALAWKGGTHDVTGMSPQSTTVAQLLKGLASRGTL